MRRVWRVVRWVLVVVLIALVGGYWYQRPLLLTATGYAAHNECAVRELSSRTDPRSDLPDNPLVPVLGVSRTGEVYSGELLGVLARQDAHYTEGFGCAVGDDAPVLPSAHVVSAAANPFADGSTPEMTPEVAEAIGRAFGDELSDSERTRLGTRGIVVVKDGVVVGERYADGFDASTPQLGWSMTKSLTSVMVGLLVQEGVVSLDDNQLRPEWTDQRAEITIEQLLRMSSGLEWDETYDLGTPITQMLYLEPDMGDYVASQPLAHDPGTYVQYSSGSTTVLCDILLERLDADANLPRETLFETIGMSSAVMEPDASGTPVCSSYAWATPRDWAAFGQFVLEEGNGTGAGLLPDGWMQQSAAASDLPTLPGDEGYGMGWWSNLLPDGTLVHPELPADAYFALGHDGQWVVVVPSENLVVVRLGFTPDLEDEGVTRLTAELMAVL